MGTGAKVAYSFFVRHSAGAHHNPSLYILLAVDYPPVLLGTSSFTAEGWEDRSIPEECERRITWASTHSAFLPWKWTRPLMLAPPPAPSLTGMLERPTNSFSRLKCRRRSPTKGFWWIAMVLCTNSLRRWTFWAKSWDRWSFSSLSSIEACFEIGMNFWTGWCRS